MKRITCFTANLGGGGAQHQMTYLANFLIEKGYDVCLVTYNDDQNDHYELNGAVRRIRLDLKGNSFIKELRLIYFFIRHKYDCVISFRSASNFVFLLAYLFSFRNKKIIVGERNTTIIPDKKERINHCFFYKMADYVVPNSYTQERYLKSLNKSWANRVKTITNYTDLDQYLVHPKQTLSLQTIEIGIFSRIFPQKNYERFCEMLCVLKKESRNSFHVTWYGDKKEGSYLKGSLHIKELIDEFNISDVLTIKDSVRNVKDLIPQFHVMCLPSLYEGFSNSISEYICCGKPVICSDVSDNSTMVQDGFNGYLFDPTDVKSMCSAFIKFFQLNDDERDKMGKNSRLIAEKLFDKERFINSYIDLIEN